MTLERIPRAGDDRRRLRLGRRADALGARRRHLARNRADRRLMNRDRSCRPRCPPACSTGSSRPMLHGDAVAAGAARGLLSRSSPRPTIWPQSWSNAGTRTARWSSRAADCRAAGEAGTPGIRRLAPGLYVSVVLDARQGERAGRLGHALTLATGVAMAEGLHAASGLPVVIKWPNDLVMAPAGTVRGARKLAGILAEAQTEGGQLSHVIVGVGVNVGPAAWPPEISSRATSLEEELGRAVDRGACSAPAWRALAPGCGACAPDRPRRSSRAGSNWPWARRRDGRDRHADGVRGAGSRAASTRTARCSCVTRRTPSASSGAR